MMFTKVYLVPIVLGIWFPVTFIITYIVAVKTEHVRPILPYISDTGTWAPESCIFGIMLTLGGFMTIIIVYVRYRQVRDTIEKSDFGVTTRRMNSWSGYMGALAAFGCILVADFQVTNVISVHILGAGLCFGLATVYQLIQGFEAQFAGENPRDVLVKNRTMLLKAFTPITLKISVLYEGSDIPTLVEYRLNARRLCPDPNTLRTDFFQGDADSQTFFSHIQAKSKQTLPERSYKCGTATDPTKQPHPWKATVHFNNPKSTRVVCSAILIHPSFFITPAHCVTFEKEEGVVPNDSLQVHLGQDLRVKVSNVIVHPGYRAGYLDDDLALLRTSVPLEVTEYVTPICLSEGKGGEGAGSERAILVGNEIEEDGVLGSKVLEAAALKISRKECETLKPQLKDVLVENTCCVSFVSDNKNCVGSSGNGLISSEDGRSTLRGVVTLGVLLQGEKGCNQNTVNVLTAIEKYKKWIERVIY